MIKLSFIFALFLYSSFSHSATVPLDFSSNWEVGSLVGQNKTLSMQRSPVIVFQSTDTNLPNFKIPSLPVQVPTSNGAKMVNLLNVTKNVTTSILGSTAAKLAKSLPYVGTAIAVGDLFCQATNICHFPNSNNGVPESVAQKSTASGVSTWRADGMTQSYDSQIAACDSFLSQYDNKTTGIGYISDTRAGCIVAPYSGYQAQISRTSFTQSITYTIPTEQEYSDAYAFFDKTQFTLSNLNLMAHFLVDNKADVPVDPADIPTQVFLIPFEGTVIRDGFGNVTGSSESTGEITVVKGSQPDTVVTTETVKTTNKSSDGTIITSSITSKGGPPADTTTPSANEPPKYPTVEIDDVKDVDLPTYSPSSFFVPSTWGEGTCPPDPSYHTQIGTLTIPLSRVCYWMSAIRPAVILIAFIVAGFIISGRKSE